MIKIVVCIFLLWPCGLWSAPEAGRYQPGRVWEKEKTPCFSVADTAETRAAPVDLSILEVNRISDGKYIPVWSIEFLKDSYLSQLSPNACLPYGLIDEASIKVRQIAQLLQPNQRYAFFINAFVPTERGNGFMNRVYRGNFCIVLDELQQPKVRQVVYDIATSEWQWNVCNRK
jgi:hypothetical protein